MDDRILYPEQKAYLDGLRVQDDPLIDEMERFARENRVPILDWKSAEFLEQLIRISRPERVLEIGTAIAYSTIRIARAARKRAKVYTIETSANNILLARQNIIKSGYQGKIKLLEGDALQLMPEMKKKFDLIFLDADKEDYLQLLEYSLALLKKRGVLFVDNLLWHGYAAAEAVPEKFTRSAEHIRVFNKVFLSRKEMVSTILPIGDGIGLGIRR